MTASPRKVIDYHRTFLQHHPDKVTIAALIELAQDSNRLARQMFDDAATNGIETLGIREKSEHFKDMGWQDVLTKVDEACEGLILKRLKSIRPIPIVSEESGHEVDDATTIEGAQRWLVDPIDGTFCLKNGSEDFSTTIALQTKKDGKWQTDIGLVAIPMHNEMYLADANGAHLIQNEREKLLVNRAPEPEAFSGSASEALDGKRVELVIFSRARKEMMAVHHHYASALGNSLQLTFSSAMAIARMADGWTDGVIIGADAMNPWDVDAAIHIAHKAGIHMKELTREGEPFILLATSKTLLNALEWQLDKSLSAAIGNQTQRA